MQKTWIEEEFHQIQREMNHDYKKIDCPICGKTIPENDLINLYKNTRHHCMHCKGYFCYFCMQEWKINYQGYRRKKFNIHHCREALIKGKYKKKAHEFFVQLETFKNDLSIYKQEKIFIEENLKKMKEYFEFLGYKNNFEKEVASLACNYYESFIGIIQN